MVKREFELKNLLDAKIGKCISQLGEQKYNEILGFFRKKLNVSFFTMALAFYRLLAHMPLSASLFILLFILLSIRGWLTYVFSNEPQIENDFTADDYNEIDEITMKNINQYNSAEVSATLRGSQPLMGSEKGWGGRRYLNSSENVCVLFESPSLNCLL